jgi:hypothetical protein
MIDIFDIPDNGKWHMVTFMAKRTQDECFVDGLIVEEIVEGPSPNEITGGFK